MESCRNEVLMYDKIVQRFEAAGLAGDIPIPSVLYYGDWHAGDNGEPNNSPIQHEQGVIASVKSAAVRTFFSPLVLSPLPPNTEWTDEDLMRWDCGAEVITPLDPQNNYGVHFSVVPKFAIIFEKWDSDLEGYTQMGKFSFQTALSVCESICSNITFLHRTVQIVHRDLKPKNVLINRINEKFPTVAFCDLASGADIDSACAVFGSPDFIEPNLGNWATEAADNYATIKILLEVLNNAVANVEFLVPAAAEANTAMDPRVALLLELGKLIQTQQGSHCKWIIFDRPVIFVFSIFKY